VATALVADAAHCVTALLTPKLSELLRSTTLCHVCILQSETARVGPRRLASCGNFVGSENLFKRVSYFQHASVRTCGTDDLDPERHTHMVAAARHDGDT